VDDVLLHHPWVRLYLVYVVALFIAVIVANLRQSDAEGAPVRAHEPRPDLHPETDSRGAPTSALTQPGSESQRHS
jgi:hypothetical protein